MSKNAQSQSQTEVGPQPNLFIGSAGRIFFWEAFLFSLTLGLGIAGAVKLNQFLRIQHLSLPPTSFGQFTLYFLFATLFILFIVSLGKKFQKGKEVLFKTIFILAVFGGGTTLLSLWLPEVLAIFLMVILIFSWLKKPMVFSHNLAIILGIAGIGSFLGLSLNPSVIISLLILFSVYDFVAVYKTKHMIKMAKEMVEAGAILGLIVSSKISDFKVSLNEIRPGGRFLILGGGDIVFPLLLCTSLIPQGVLESLIVATFSFAGLFLSFLIFISQENRRPMPALPPIALFSILGFLITKIF